MSIKRQEYIHLLRQLFVCLISCKCCEICNNLKLSCNSDRKFSTACLTTLGSISCFHLIFFMLLNIVDNDNLVDTTSQWSFKFTLLYLENKLQVNEQLFAIKRNLKVPEKRSPHTVNSFNSSIISINLVHITQTHSANFAQTWNKASISEGSFK